MQTRPYCQAKPRDIAGIRWNLGFDENDMERGIHGLNEDLTTEDTESTEENKDSEGNSSFILHALRALRG